jgi:ABC-2 type transport system ATP-binding protein
MENLQMQPDNQKDPVIHSEDLGKEFGQMQAVASLSLEVMPGEIFGLVGPDGAGKTTTMRMLTAIMLPSWGWAEVLGFDTVTQAEALKAHIGYMAQRFNLYRDLTVMENLNFFADIFEVPSQARAARMERLLEFARLGRFKDRRAGHLSGGMQKKLSLACTLVHEPKVLFLDEPTTGVDPVSRREFWEILTDLHMQGITIFVSTPYMDEAERCSRVGLLYQGELIACDRPEQIRQSLAGELLEIQTPNVMQAQQVVIDLENVIETQTYGNLLHVFVQDAGKQRRQLSQALESAGVPVESLRTARPRMEEAFISLIRKQERD